MIRKIGTIAALLILFATSEISAGAFYANLTVLDAAPEALDEVLKEQRWDGILVQNSARPRTAVVCERRLDDQDPAWGEALATTLSTALGCAVLYTLVHDSDVLLLSLAAEGQVIFRYDSWPDYFNGGKQNPRITNLQNAARVLSVDVAALRDLLTAPPSPSYLDADDRLLNFTHLAGLPEYVAGAGYRYLQQDPTYLDQYQVVIRPFGPRVNP